MSKKNIINMLIAIMIPVSIMAFRESSNPDLHIWNICGFVVLLVVALMINISHDGRGLHDYISDIKSKR